MYKQLGLKSWQRRQSFFDNTSLDSPTDSEAHPLLPQSHEANIPSPAAEQGSVFVEEIDVNQSQKDRVYQLYETVDKQSKQTAEPELDKNDLKLASTNEVLLSKNAPLKTEPETLSKATAVSNAIVLIGRGLDSIWENDEDVAWRLWQNIVQALGWKDENVVFFDLDCLVSEEAVFSTMEEIIDLAVESVLAMDIEHVLTEQLAEGIQVVEVPDLESMLSDPYAKQTFYQTVMSRF